MARKAKTMPDLGPGDVARIGWKGGGILVRVTHRQQGAWLCRRVVQTEHGFADDSEPFFVEDHDAQVLERVYDNRTRLKLADTVRVPGAI